MWYLIIYYIEAVTLCQFLRVFVYNNKCFVFQTKVIDLIKVHIFSSKHFFLQVILSEKISDF